MRSPIRTSLLAFLVGFSMEASTEVYQLFTVGNLGSVWIGFYYLSLGTTVGGFVLFYVGARSWLEAYPRLPRVHHRPSPVLTITALGAGFVRKVAAWGDSLSRRLRRGRRIPWRALSLAAGAIQDLAVGIEEIRRKEAPAGRGFPWSAVILFLAGALAIALLAVARGVPSPSGLPVPVVSLVGGGVVLAFGAFFFGLARRTYRTLSGWARSFVWAAFAWALGVAGLAGLRVGDLIVIFLREFVSNWGALVVSFAPVAYLMAWLFPSYLLLIAAYWDAIDHLGSSEITESQSFLDPSVTTPTLELF